MITGTSDPQHRRRFMLALACAIAIHEILIGAGGFLRIPHEMPEHPAPTQTITIERIAAIPTPRATQPPTPPPVATPAMHREVAAPRATTIAQHSGGHRGAPKLEVHNRTVHHRQTLPSWYTAMRASKTTANTGASTVGAGTGAAGTGEGAGAGSETGAGGGTGGNGSGAINADMPCGTPIFYGLRAKYNPRNGSFDEDVRVELHLENGEVIKGDFHYPWHYASEQDNPFSPRWTGNPWDAIPAQLPPPGFIVAGEPSAVQLTLKYTLPNGITRLPECPT
ncbi:MAG: hypothetical protein JO101_04910 [Candidatus Eremiobacteraeota bacterium]|nr:hypothetical protein [Candidatus Eremiobacteraeota bacterium]MBV8354640.1 hypothetical protein [Candidatus Eremiobacteraeota bacterium]